MALINEKARVLKNVCVGPKLYTLELEAPCIAQNIKPGQFVHMLIPGMEAHILRRPFSIYRKDVSNNTIEILYQVVGFGSEFLTTLNPSHDVSVELMGCIGNTWNPREATRVLLVAGGVGSAPLYLLCEELVKKGCAVTVVLGAQTKDALTAYGAYENLVGEKLLCATDDGSFGREGFCTSLVEEALKEAEAQKTPFEYVAVCGPEPLMKIVSEQAVRHHVRCEISLEKRMACGIGACLSCVVETVEGKKRSCVDGPIFAAEKVVW